MSKLPYPEKRLREDNLRKGALIRSSTFKYYIHDRLDACCFELIGELTEQDLEDLNGCWETIKSTLKGRTLVLDVRKLNSAEEAAKQWIATRTDEGASCFPECYLRKGLAGTSISPSSSPRMGFWARLVAILRGTVTAK